jgi:hypothetical protein
VRHQARGANGRRSPNPSAAKSTWPTRPTGQVAAPKASTGLCQPCTYALAPVLPCRGLTPATERGIWASYRLRRCRSFLSRLTLLSAGWMTRHRAKHGRPLIDAPCRPTTCARPRPLAGLHDRLQALGARRAAQGRLVAGQAGGSRCLRLGSMLDFPRLRPPTSTASDRTSTDVPQTFECGSSSWLDTAQTIAVSAGQSDPFNRRLQTRSEWRS